ncbi:hypothetical protein SH2C18_49850 [Clostridium sediminicola]|uniref:S-adenosylmethionine decarboxylase n=1 Tax=Clostridium sediminicola TaxID=3114879 RepID=UPI0031F21F67
MKIEQYGSNTLIRYYDCNCEVLSNPKSIDRYMREAATKINKAIIDSVFHIFNPYGVSVVVNIKEARLTIYTFPGYGYAVVSLIAHGSTINPEPAFKYLNEHLKVITCGTRSIGIILSILGSAGGVAKSVLSLLNKAIHDNNDPIHYLLKSCNIHLIDCKQKGMDYYERLFPNLQDKITLYEINLNDTNKFKAHLKKTRTTHVIDVSYADTVEMLRCCNECKVVYINSAFENTSVDKNADLEGFTLQERYKIYEYYKPEFSNTTAIICSGMNPGVVQWMAVKLIKELPNEMPQGCYIVEEDTSFYEDESIADKDTIYSTWSPVCFLDEAILSYPAFMKEHMSIFLYKEVYELQLKVTLGEKQFYGCLMPHEEAIMLGKLFDIESGFIYKVNEHTTNLIKNNLGNLDCLWNKPMKVLDPVDAPLKGQDLVGVLLVYKDKERYMYNVSDNKEIFSKYGTNATYFQVACGIYGALATVLLDDIPQGIYYVDELIYKTNSKYGEYLSYYMEKFIIGENKHVDGDLLHRIKKDR